MISKTTTVKDGRSWLSGYWFLLAWRSILDDVGNGKLNIDRVQEEQAIQQGVASDDFFGTALGEKEGRYEGFQLAVPHVQTDDSLLLAEPGAARLYRDSLAPAPVVQDTAPTQPELGGGRAGMAGPVQQ